jgi:hypothetical protein
MWLPPIIKFAHVPPLMVPATSFGGAAFWLLVTGLVTFWLFAYVLAIHRARVDKRVGIPTLAVVGDVAWEGVHSLVIQGFQAQRLLDFAWFLVDLVILWQVFLYGNKDFPAMSSKAYRAMVLGALAWAVAFMILMTREFSDVIGLYDGNILVMFLSWSFVYTLRKRKSSAGQSMYVAIFKWLGTFLACVNTAFVYPHRLFLLFTFATAFVLDVTYMVMLHRQIRAEGASPWAFNRPPVAVHDQIAPSGAVAAVTPGITASAGTPRG